MKSTTEKKERSILWLSFGMGIIFAATELIMAVVTHSQSVLMDGAYDSAELVIIGLTLFLSPLFFKPLTEKRPFGYAQVESIFIIIKGFMLLSVSLGLSVANIQMALSGGNHVNGQQVSILQLVLGLVSLLVLFIMKYWNRSHFSPIIQAEIYGWKVDVAYSLGMAGAFFVSTLLVNTPLAPILPYFDQVIAVLLVLFMLPENVKMLWRALKDVFLFSPEEEIMDDIKSICNPILAQGDFQVIFYDVTRTGRRLWITISVSFPEEMLSMEKLSQTQKNLNESICAQYPQGDVDLVIVAEE